MLKTNIWPVVTARRLIQWGLYQKMRLGLSQGLIDEKRRIASLETLSDEQRARLRDLNWRLGSGSLYYFTPEQREEQARIAKQIIQEMKGEQER